MSKLTRPVELTHLTFQEGDSIRLITLPCLLSVNDPYTSLVIIIYVTHACHSEEISSCLSNNAHELVPASETLALEPGG